MASSLAEAFVAVGIRPQSIDTTDAVEAFVASKIRSCEVCGNPTSTTFCSENCWQSFRLGITPAEFVRPYSTICVRRKR